MKRQNGFIFMESFVKIFIALVFVFTIGSIAYGPIKTLFSNREVKAENKAELEGVTINILSESKVSFGNGTIVRVIEIVDSRNIDFIKKDIIAITEDLQGISTVKLR